MINIDEIEDRFSIEGEVGFYEGDGDLIYISVCNKYADAEICLYGAHVTNFIPNGSLDLLWMSPDSEFEVGKPIRGGIPLCFPWFGPQATDSSKPVHGFARIMYWDVAETASLENGETFIKLQLESSEETKQYWPHDFRAELNVTIGRTLTVSLNIYNTDNKPFEYSVALHSYFSVSEIKNVLIEGLKGVSYYNGFGNELAVQEENLIKIEKEENRRYVNTASECLIFDTVFRRVIKAEKKGSNVTVVWNPWDETCAKMSDIPDGDYQAFVCVEAVNAYNDTIILAPGTSHATTAMLSSEFRKGEFNLGGDNIGFSVV
jgi:glucose-6-phosphate 1-epimerase